VIIKFTKKADMDLDYFKKIGNQQIIKKVKELLESIDKDTYKGIGQPELLKHDLSGVWSKDK
jgi:toxin YoeB